jgi:hypothetical protein
VRSTFRYEIQRDQHLAAVRCVEPRYLENGTFMGYGGCLVDVIDYHDAVIEIERLKLSSYPWRFRFKRRSRVAG